MSRKINWKKGRDLILYVDGAPEEALQGLKDYANKHGMTIRVGTIIDNKRRITPEKLQELNTKFDVVIRTNLSSPTHIIKALKPFESELLAISCRVEASMGKFKKIIPHVSYLRTPVEDAIEAASDKTKMRRRFMAYNPAITPQFAIVHDTTEATIEKIEKKVGFPLVVKPAGLAASLLVTICYHEDELITALRKNFRAIKKHYKTRDIDEEPKILVEQFMDGEMYSIDSYVNSRGQIKHCPPVHVQTGRTIGFDDFFNYYQVTPTNLSKKSISDMENVTEQGIRALGLTNSSAHTELIRTEKGWKLIEIGARVGGFRQKFYDMSYGINHSANDILTRIPGEIRIPKKVKGYSGILKFYAKKEGRLQKIKGLKKIETLYSVKHIEINRQPGDMCRFAKHGGKSVVNVILFNPSKSKFLADKRRIEQNIKIELQSKTRS
jgi:biotin carboxylase